MALEEDRMAKNMRGSQLRPPSRIPATPGLLEMSHSDANVRAMMPPPPAFALKHKVSGLPEPPVKRKTLVERAGELSRPVSTSISQNIRSVNPVKGTTLVIVKPASHSSSTSRVPSGSSRNTSSSSSTSVSTTATRPASATGSHRSQSALGHARTISQDHGWRAAGAIDEDDEADDEVMGPTNRKGMTIPSKLASHKQDGLCPRKQRSPRAAPSCRYIKSCAAIPRSSQAQIQQDPLRTFSLTDAFHGLRLQSDSEKPSTSASSPKHQDNSTCPETPSHIPKAVLATPRQAQVTQPQRTPLTKPSVCNLKSTPCKLPYLTRDSNNLAPAWDTKGRLADMETLYSQLRGQMEGAAYEKNGLEETLTIYKKRLEELELSRSQLSATTQAQATELETTRSKLSSTKVELEDAQRNNRFTTDDLERRHRNEMEDSRDRHRREVDALERQAKDDVERSRKEVQDEADKQSRQRREEVAERERELKEELELERSKRLREVQETTTQYALQRQTVDLDLSRKDRELQGLRDQLDEANCSLDRANALVEDLKAKLTEMSTNSLTQEASLRAMKAKIDFLESDNQAQSQAFADLNQKMQDAVDSAAVAHDKLRTEETLRRKLHNQVQELKGNIRVFCRVRPVLESDGDDNAKIGFPDADSDGKEVAVQGPEQKSALGNVTTATSAFSFDRVFAPKAENGEVFEEISQLVQSALDGYNVCIFCYGQTGSGKTYTMSAADGMIPRTVNQIYQTAQSLEDKGWKYSMHGSFIEVYNETLNDLLGRAEDWEKKKHEIKQDPAKCKTTVTDVTTVELDSPSRVNAILDKASRNRSVAATKANSRSSRSHSVFILRLVGDNSITGERSEGTLNLVDLAGSERLSHSGATGERMKETQHINKSLSCLGDVISALGQGKEAGHVPYRNSKLTYLLQYSLGGNSKTLMFVMISPLQAHLNETLTSLKFATKVHNTHIGTAKRQARVKD